MKKTEKVEKKNNITELVFILDKSGSMSGLESDTIGGFNSMIKKQKEEKEGEVLVTTVLFSSDFTMIHNRKPLEEIPEMTGKDYFVGGCTALIDAIGRSIDYIEDTHKAQPEDKIPANVLFVITTDGYENASKKYSSREVKRMVSAKQETGWQFIFMGANIDAVETAANYGIKAECAVDYRADALGTQVNFEALNEAVCSVRKAGSVGKKWKKMVEDDYANRE